MATTRQSRHSGILLGSLALSALAGCATQQQAAQQQQAHAQQKMTATHTTHTTAESAKPCDHDIDVQRRTIYEGRDVYYHHDRWYYRENGQWHYYRVEPEPLARHRTNVQQASAMGIVTPEVDSPRFAMPPEPSAPGDPAEHAEPVDEEEGRPALPPPPR